MLESGCLRLNKRRACIIGVNPLVSTVSGHPRFLEEKGLEGEERKGERDGSKETLPDFTWIDATGMYDIYLLKHSLEWDK